MAAAQIFLGRHHAIESGGCFTPRRGGAEEELPQETKEDAKERWVRTVDLSDVVPHAKPRRTRRRRRRLLHLHPRVAYATCGCKHHPCQLSADRSAGAPGEGTRPSRGSCRSGGSEGEVVAHEERASAERFCRPCRGWLLIWGRNPALTRWAIIFRCSAPVVTAPGKACRGLGSFLPPSRLRAFA